MASVPRKIQPNHSSVINALIYTRVSTEDQAREGVSLDAQLADCRKYAARNAWVLGKEYQDILSGKRDDRPAYQLLLADVRALRSEGASVVVVVAALDRFGRRLLERVRSREELKALGVSVHSVREGGEVSDLVANMLGAVAQEEVRWLGERVRVARAYVAERGFMPAGRVPWGYLRRPATAEERAAGAPLSVLDVDEAVAPYTRELFERVDSGASVRQAARWVGSLPPTLLQGKVLAFAAVRRILRSPVYIARAPDATGDVLSCPVNRWPAIVDDGTWLRVQQRIDNHAVQHHQASGRYLLTGFLKCPSCGGPVAGHQMNGGAYRYYNCAEENSHGTARCGWGAPVRTIDTSVLDLVNRILAPFASADHAFRTALEQSWRALQQPGEVGVQRDQRITRLKREGERSRQRLADAATMFVDGAIDREGYELVRDRSQKELAAVEEELGRLQAAVQPSTLPPLSEVLAQVGEWGTLLKQAEITLQREVLAVLIQRVDAARVGYGRYGVRVRWTPTGAALAGLAGVSNMEPADLHVVPFARYVETRGQCEVCGTEFLGYGRRRYCGKPCKDLAARQRRAARLAGGGA